jgi:hypothetical protein
MESIIQKEKQCLVCGTTYNLHSHHIFGGTSNRKQSEKYGLKVWLCAYHHNMSNEGVHFNKHLDNHLKQMGQRHFETRYGNREEFIKVFGKSYL